jgi:hypothetical protein
VDDVVDSVPADHCGELAFSLGFGLVAIPCRAERVAVSD